MPTPSSSYVPTPSSSYTPTPSSVSSLSPPGSPSSSSSLAYVDSCCEDAFERNYKVDKNRLHHHTVCNS
jgi:hypothetical protein